MAKNFRELQERRSPESRERVDALVIEAEKDMLLTEMHRMMQAADPQIFADQPAIRQRIADQDDLPLTTIYRIVKNLGGELRFTAMLPNQIIEFPPTTKTSQDAA